ncbi:MAG TPA: hypothetical protein VJG90_00950 [Candidatus Nanoarchaeia archaeon]|nr:hypothetical protein [Candidatus Nanoarchaeia archaeon]
MKEPIEIAKFAFGIRGVVEPNGEVMYYSDSNNKKVPKEIVILKLKALVKKMEKEYFA